MSITPPSDVRVVDSAFRRVRAAALACGLGALAAGCVDARPPLALATPEITLATPEITLASAVRPDPGVARQARPARSNAEFAHLYQGKADEKFPIPATRISGVNPKFFRQQVNYPRSERPGTIVVDPTNRFLYLVQEGGKAMRYGVGVGRAGMAWSGTARVGRKAEWPRWTPTPAMIARDPERNEPWKNGMPPGLRNPLGPRALYLFEGGKDTLYRIHGTNEPDTIGASVSSGCIRMFNEDIIDLYNRVPVDSSVVVLPKGERVEPSPETVVARRGEGAAQPAVAAARPAMAPMQTLDPIGDEVAPFDAAYASGEDDGFAGGSGPVETDLL